MIRYTSSISFLVIVLTGLGNAQQVTIADGDVVRAPSGAVYRIEFGFRKRFPNQETMEALNIDPKAIKDVPQGVIDNYDDGGAFVEHKVISKRAASDSESTDIQTITIPEGWTYVSHTARPDGANQGSFHDEVSRDPRTQVVLSVSIKAKGGPQDTVVGLPVKNGLKMHFSASLFGETIRHAISSAETIQLNNLVL